MSVQPDAHEWYSVDDPDGTTWLFDITFLASSWTCIWGRGCPGIHDEPHPELQQGCCTYGAHFADKADRKRVGKYIERLTPAVWQHHDAALALDGAIYKNDDDEWVTRTVGNACILFNQPGFDAGSGCALHIAATHAEERALDWKPEVCWQLPLRLDHAYDDNEHLTYTLREWKRRDWGEGGNELHWWCTDDDKAFVGNRPVYRELREELIELVGEWPYQHVTDYLERHRTNAQAATPVPHPVLKTSRSSTDRLE